MQLLERQKSVGDSERCTAATSETIRQATSMRATRRLGACQANACSLQPNCIVALPLPHVHVLVSPAELRAILLACYLASFHTRNAMQVGCGSQCLMMHDWTDPS